MKQKRQSVDITPETQELLRAIQSAQLRRGVEVISTSALVRGILSGVAGVAVRNALARCDDERAVADTVSDLLKA